MVWYYFFVNQSVFIGIEGIIFLKNYMAVVLDFSHGPCHCWEPIIFVHITVIFVCPYNCQSVLLDCFFLCAVYSSHNYLPQSSCTKYILFLLKLKAWLCKFLFNREGTVYPDYFICSLCSFPIPYDLFTDGTFKTEQSSKCRSTIDLWWHYTTCNFISSPISHFEFVFSSLPYTAGFREISLMHEPTLNLNQ